jgi:hypothetical protein
MIIWQKIYRMIAQLISISDLFFEEKPATNKQPFPP